MGSFGAAVGLTETVACQARSKTTVVSETHLQPQLEYSSVTPAIVHSLGGHAGLPLTAVLFQPTLPLGHCHTLKP